MNNRHQQTTEDIMGLSTTNPSQNETNSGASNLHFIDCINNLNSYLNGQCLNPRD